MITVKKHGLKKDYVRKWIQSFNFTTIYREITLSCSEATEVMAKADLTQQNTRVSPGYD